MEPLVAHANMPRLEPLHLIARHLNRADLVVEITAREKPNEIGTTADTPPEESAAPEMHERVLRILQPVVVSEAVRLARDDRPLGRIVVRRIGWRDHRAELAPRDFTGKDVVAEVRVHVLVIRAIVDRSILGCPVPAR